MQRGLGLLRFAVLILFVLTAFVVTIAFSCKWPRDTDANHPEDESREFKIENSPIGGKLFFLKGESVNEADDEYPGTIYVADFSTEKVSKVLSDSFDAKCGNCDISRDGSKIIFGSNKDGNWDIGLADLKSNYAGNPKRITHSQNAREEDCKFSFTGDKIVYHKDWSIFVYDLQNKNEQPITNTGQDWAPVFSPDNRWIAFGRRKYKDSPPGDVILFDLYTLTEKLLRLIDIMTGFPRLIMMAI
jgi:Tol biopolymer transport system component